MTPVAQALSTALLHFVWQGIAVSILLATVLFAVRKSSASLRYAASCLALVVLFAAPLVTGYAAYQFSEPESGGGWYADSLWIDASGAVAEAGTVSGNLYAWIIPAWFAGVVVFAIRLLWAGGHSYSLRRQGTLADASIAAMVLKLAEGAGIRRSIQVLLSSVADVPSVVGWLRPVILLPPAAILGLTAQQLEAVIAHELAHIRRNDYLVNILQMVVETLFFYHPAVWWISSRIRYERELCCDDFAVRSCGDAVTYARALAQLEKLRPAIPSLAMGSANGPLLHRIQRVLGFDGIEHGPSKLACAVALLVGVLSLGFFMNNASAQQETQQTLLPQEPQVHPLPQAISDQPALFPATPLPPSPSLVTPAKPATAQAAAPPAARTSAAPVRQAPQPSQPPQPPATPVPFVLELIPLLQRLSSLSEIRWVSIEGTPGLSFRLDGKTYTTRDKEIMDRVRALNPVEDTQGVPDLSLSRQQLSELIKANALLEVQLSQMKVQLRNMPRDLDDPQKDVAELQRQLDRLAASNGQIEATVREREQQLLRMQAELAAIEADKSRRQAERRRTEDILREAVVSGKAEVVP